MWYVIHLAVGLDKFLARYPTLASAIVNSIQEMITLRRPHKTMYQRDLGIFVGYVFVQVDPRDINRLHRALKEATLGEVLSPPGGRYLMPLTPDEVQWIYNLMQSSRANGVETGHPVRITEGPYEGLEGSVESIVGQTVEVRIPLRRSVALVQCTADSLEAVDMREAA